MDLFSILYLFNPPPLDWKVYTIAFLMHSVRSVRLVRSVHSVRSVRSVRLVRSVHSVRLVRTCQFLFKKFENQGFMDLFFDFISLQSTPFRLESVHNRVSDALGAFGAFDAFGALGALSAFGALGAFW
jgi:hypothetical protein